MNSTLTPAPVKTNGTRRHLFTMTLTIDDAAYSAYPVRQIEDPEIERAFTLAKQGRPDAVYTVARHADGRVTCECPDFVARHEDRGTLCKHGQCCVRMGLLDAPTARQSLNNVKESVPARFPEPITAPEPATPPARQPELRRIAGMTIDLDVWRNGPRAAQEPAREFGEGLEEPESPRTVETPTAAPRPCCGPAEAEPCQGCVEGMTVSSNDGHSPGFVVEPADAVHETLDHAPDRLSLADWLRLQIDFYRGFGTDAADLVAEHLGELVAEAEITKASTPAQLRDRRAVLAMP